jgi:ABC-type sugar transport system permease subunit
LDYPIRINRRHPQVIFIPGANTTMIGIRKRFSSPEWRRIIGDYAFLSPQLILYLLFTIIPFFVAVPILFTNRLTFFDNTVNFIGLSNFKEIFIQASTTAQDFWPAFARTLRFTLLNYMMVYIFGLGLALLMYEIGFRGGFFTIIYLPMMLSGLAIGFVATMLFSQSTGTLNLLLLKLGWIHTAIDIKLPTGTTVILPILVGWRFAGFNMAIFLSGLMGIPVETIEASIVDGASYWRRLISVYFPQMMPSFIIATIFALIGSFGIFDELIAMGALYGNQEASFLSILFFRYGFSQGRLALGMTLAMEVGIPLMILGVLLQRLQKRLQY